MKRHGETKLKNSQRQSDKLSVSSGTRRRKEEVYLLLSGAFRFTLLPKREEVIRMGCKTNHRGYRRNDSRCKQGKKDLAVLTKAGRGTRPPTN